jgi:hypothetical protein
MVNEVTLNYESGNKKYVEEVVPPSSFRIKDSGMHVPSQGSFVRVKHDFELEEYNFKPRQLSGLNVKYPLPENRKTRPMWNSTVYDYVPIPERHQWFLWDIFKFALEDRIPHGKIEDATYVKTIKGTPTTFNTYTPGSLTEAYANMIERSRDFTDSRAVEDGFADYPTGRHMGKPPWNWRCITHGGQLLKRTGKTFGNYIEVFAIDLLATPPKVEDVFYSPWLIQWAVQITTEEIAPLDGKRRWVVSRFPQIKEACRQNNLPFMGTPFPLWGFGGVNRIHKDYVIPVQNDSEFSPYVP